MGKGFNSTFWIADLFFFLGGGGDGVGWVITLRMDYKPEAGVGNSLIMGQSKTGSILLS